MKISEAAPQQFLQLLSQYVKGTLSAGDRLTGRILTAADGLLLMQLPDGSKISAQARPDSNYAEGDILNLEVIGEKDGQLLVHEIQHSHPQQTNAPVDPLNILKTMNLPADRRYIGVARAILDMGVTPSADLIRKAVGLLKDGQVSEARHAAFLTLNEMDHNEAYFQLIRKLDGEDFHFHGRLQSLLNEIVNLNDESMISIADGFITAAFLQEPEVDFLLGQMEALLRDTDTPELMGQKDFTMNILSDLIDRNNLNFSDIRTFLNELISLSRNEIPQSKEVLNIIRKFIPEADFNEEAFAERLTEALARNPEKQDLTQYNEPVTLGRAKDILLRAGRELSPGETVRTDESALPKTDQWFRGIARKLQIIHTVLSKADSPEAERLLSEVRELQTTIQFFNDIKSYEVFVQIPVMLKENLSEGELYIMKRKGSGEKLTADDFSLFLSLTTKNLGVTDTFVHVKNKNVMLRVMVEDEKFYPLLLNQYKALYEALRSRGYRMYEMKYSLRNEGTDLFNAVKKARDLAQTNGKIDVKV